MENNDICGICGDSGADKVALWVGGGVYWPGEYVPETEFVHQSCEQAETQRAFNQLSQSQKDSFLNQITQG